MNPILEAIRKTREENPKMYKMHIYDPEGAIPNENLWVEYQGGGVAKVCNVPISNMINLNDLVNVRFDGDSPEWQCEFVSVKEQKMESFWVGIENDEDAKRIHEFGTRHEDTFAYARHAREVIKVCFTLGSDLKDKFSKELSVQE